MTIDQFADSILANHAEDQFNGRVLLTLEELRGYLTLARKLDLTPPPCIHERVALKTTTLQGGAVCKTWWECMNPACKQQFVLHPGRTTEAERIRFNRWLREHLDTKLECVTLSYSS
jgi:hypothetical protein